jgi:type I restriction enzyme, S subunit
MPDNLMNSDDQLNLFPSDWGQLKLGEVLQDVNVKMRTQQVTNVPILSITRHGGLVLQSNKFDKRVASKDISNYKFVCNGQIVVGFPIDEGVIFQLRDFECGAVSPAYQVWRIVNSNVDGKFLDQLLKVPFMIDKYRMLSSNTVQRRRSISKRDFLELSISLPPLPEQRRIAAVLNAIQEAIAAQDDVIAAARAFKRSLMQRIFTYGPDKEPAETKETEIREIPAHWELIRLGEVLSETQYGINNRAELKGTYPVLRMNNLVDGKIDIADLKYVDLASSEFDRYRLNQNDVLFNRTNSYELVGKTSIFELEGKYTFASYLVRVVPKSAVLMPGYLNYCLNAEVTQARLKQFATRGVSQSNISPTKLKQLVIGLPPIPEQLGITGILESMDQKIAAEEDRNTALHAFFKSMLHQLMTGQIRLCSDGGLPVNSERASHD